MGVETRRRRTQAERREQTRRALIEAADRAFSRHGFHGASLEAIAEDAGYSKGAVYGRFGGKDELFLAVLEDRFLRRLAVHGDAWTSEESFTDRLVAAALAQSREIREDRAWSAAWVEFAAHATRDPELQRRLRELDHRLLRQAAERFAELGGLRERDAAYFTAVALMISSGMSVERLLDPDAVADDHIERFVRAIGADLEGARDA